MNQSISTLNSLLKRHPNEVATVLRSTGVVVPRNSNARTLAKTIENNRNNSQMIQGLSGMILADIRYTDSSDYSTFVEPRPAVDPLTGSTLQQDTGGEVETKVGFFKKIGSGISNLFNKNKNNQTDDGLGTNDAQQGSGVKQWFKDNSSDILDVGKSLIGGLFNKDKDSPSQSPSPNTGGGFNPDRFNQNQPPTSTGLSTGAKIGIGAGLLAVTVLIVVLVRRGGKGGK